MNGTARIFGGIFLIGVAGFYFSRLAPGLVWSPSGYGSLLASIQGKEYFFLSPSPLYFFLGQLWKNLPGGSLAFRGNLWSLVIGVGCAFLVYRLILNLCHDWRFATIGGLIFAFFPQIQSFVLIGNFYVLLLFCELALLMLLCQENPSVFSLSLIWGLALSTYPSAVVFLIPLIVFIFYERPRGKKPPVPFFGGLLCGLLPLLVEILFFPFSIAHYFSTLGLLIPFAGSFMDNGLSFLESFFSFSWLFFPFFLVGILWGIEGKKRVILISSLFSFLLLFGIYPFEEGVGLYILVYTLFAVFCALGAKVVWDLARLLSDTELGAAFDNRFFVMVFRLRKEGGLFRYLLLGGFLTLLLFLSVQQGWSAPLPYESNGADDYGERVWQNLPFRALVLTEEPKYLSILRYFSALDPNRNAVITTTGLVFDFREQVRLKRYCLGVRGLDFLENVDSEQEAGSALREFVAANLGSRPVFLATTPPLRSTKGSWGEYELISHGPLYKVIEQQ